MLQLPFASFSLHIFFSRRIELKEKLAQHSYWIKRPVRINDLRGPNFQHERDFEL